jgi:hypothetical protein
MFSLRSSGDEAQPTPMPLLLQKVQALGELHTARYTYQHVFEQQTSRKPQEWAQAVPMVASLVRASTTNSGLVSATAQVEAGVDLSQAKLEGSTLIVPKPHVYRPAVEARMHEVRRGLLWRDDNLALTAVGAMETRVRTAAVEQGILTEAEKNARKQLQTLLTGSKAQIEFR